MQTFLYGRHGYDKLSYHMVWVALGFSLLSMFLLKHLFTFLYVLLLGIVVFRTLSKNNVKRCRELYAYERFLGAVKRFFKLQKNKYADRKTHKYFRCKCKAVLRVPKGKGRIIVHCPKCKRSVEKKT